MLAGQASVDAVPARWNVLDLTRSGSRVQASTLSVDRDAAGPVLPPNFPGNQR